jgi:hypothetical protein
MTTLLTCPFCDSMPRHSYDSMSDVSTLSCCGIKSFLIQGPLYLEPALISNWNLLVENHRLYQADSEEKQMSMINNLWIPMDEERPPFGVNICITIKEESGEIMELAKYCYDNYNERPYFLLSEGLEDIPQDKVLAWMPLPKPYRPS